MIIDDDMLVLPPIFRFYITDYVGEYKEITVISIGNGMYRMQSRSWDTAGKETIFYYNIMTQDEIMDKIDYFKTTFTVYSESVYA